MRPTQPAIPPSPSFLGEPRLIPIGGRATSASRRAALGRPAHPMRGRGGTLRVTSDASDSASVRSGIHGADTRRVHQSPSKARMEIMSVCGAACATRRLEEWVVANYDAQGLTSPSKKHRSDHLGRSEHGILLASLVLLEASLQSDDRCASDLQAVRGQFGHSRPGLDQRWPTLARFGRIWRPPTGRQRIECLQRLGSDAKLIVCSVGHGSLLSQGGPQHSLPSDPGSQHDRADASASDGTGRRRAGWSAMLHRCQA